MHIPFCNNKCIYCDFVSTVEQRSQESYVKALICEIEREKCNQKIDSVYIGGGTPSTLYDGAILEVLNAVQQCFVLQDSCEITIELNPESVTEKKLIEYKKAGVNRISMGLQCADDDMLKSIGRKHSVQTFMDASKSIRQHFDNFSTDLILGLPLLKNDSQNDKSKSELSFELINKSIETALECQVKHISAYALKIEQKTRLHKKQCDFDLCDDDLIAILYDYTVEQLSKRGFHRYEISNFALQGYQSKHNLKYWTNGDYYGFGVSACGRHGLSYVKNTDNIKKYISGALPNVDKISVEQYKQDCIMLSLRLTRGLSLSKYRELFKEDLLQTKSAQINQLLDNGFITIESDRLRVLEKYLYVSNSIILKIIN
ncbi:MAG: radical SAM family heme chaperone HemW [Clostridiales bacterium]|nr:radical SAM family heme chaperone HemW [Clostridiales bacterium]